MNLKDLWMLYEADKRILGFSSHTLKTYSLTLSLVGGDFFIQLK